MSLPNEQSAVTYIGNNSAVVAYPVPFRFFEDDDLTVFVINASGEKGDALNLNIDYTVTGGNGSTGSVISAAPISDVNRVLIERNVQLTQPTSFSDVGKFPSSSVDRSFDRLTMQVQQLDRRFSESIIFAEDDFLDGGTAAATSSGILDGGNA